MEGDNRKILMVRWQRCWNYLTLATNRKIERALSILKEPNGNFRGTNTISKNKNKANILTNSVAE